MAQLPLPSRRGVLLTGLLLGCLLPACGGDPESQEQMAGQGASVRLGSWNIRKLGHGPNKNYGQLAKVIQDSFDAVGIMEIMQNKGGHPGFDALREALGKGWEGMVTDSPRPRDDTGGAEFYGLFYRTALFKPCPGWEGKLVYVTDNDGGDAGTGENLWAREPAYTCLRAGFRKAGVGTDFAMALYHAIFVQGRIGAITHEVAHVEDMFRQMQEALPQEKDLLLFGDLNLDPPQLDRAIEYNTRTACGSSTLDQYGELTGHCYDHVLIHDEVATPEVPGKAEVLDVRRYAESNFVFYRTMSDHLPIRILMRIDLPDDD
ncbi:MAG: hypothetical protein HY744_06370 [Deltaproteobacteria bacterium]|nr:hypothetical protein [Deltaproteobacteria bacterium]